MIDKTKRRGAILIQALIMGVIVATIAAGLMKMVLMNYIIVDKATKGTQNRKESESMLNAAISDWNRDGVCSNFSGVSCSPTTPPCTCTGNPAGGSIVIPTIVVTGAVPPHTMTLTSSDPQ